VDVLRGYVVSSRMVTRHSNYFFRLWSDLSDPRATLDVLISFLILLIFLEKKEANTCCLRAFQLGGFVSLSPVSKCVHVLFKFLFIIFKKKVC